MLRRILVFGSKKSEATAVWRKLRNEHLDNLHSSQSIIRMIMSRRMRWVGHVARFRKIKMRLGYRWESQKKEDH
jgi:hypothetical protein